MTVRWDIRREGRAWGEADDPAQREANFKSVNMLTQPATQVVVRVNWKP